MRLSNATTATSTRRAASGSTARSKRKASSPASMAASGSPAMEPEVSSRSTQGQRGSGFSANSTASSSLATSDIGGELLGMDRTVGGAMARHASGVESRANTLKIQ